jgi:hypothetical protein
MSMNWRVYGSDTVMYCLDKAELPGWIRKKVVVGPGEGAIILRDGRPEQLLTQASENVQGLLDGVAGKLLGWLTGREEVKVIFFDLSPIRVPVYLGEVQKQEQASATTPTADGWLHAERASNVSILVVTADKEVICAECIVTLQLDSNNLAAIAGLLKNSRGVSRWDLAAMIRDEALARVLVPHIAKVNAKDIRGNRDLVTTIASWTRAELEQSLRPWGLVLVDLVINWGLTDSERQEVDRRRAEIAEEAKKFDHHRRLAEMQRGLEIDKTRLENLQQLKLAEAQNQETLKDLYLSGQLKRDKLVEGRRVDTATVDAEIRSIQLDVQKKEGELRLEQRRAEQLVQLDVDEKRFQQEQKNRLANVDAEDKELRGMVAMQIQMATAKHDRQMAERRLELDSQYQKMRAELDARFDERKIRLEEDLARMSQVKDLLSQGLSSGAVNSEVLTAFLSESTKQSFGTASAGNAAAMFEADKAKNNLGTYQSAEDRERRQQQEMTKLAADMMQSSKQTPGATVVTGLGGAPAAGPGIHVATPSSPANSSSYASADGLAARLAKLKKLFEAGMIDEAEFKQKKAAIVDEV